jgi:hypothetical protein
MNRLQVLNNRYGKIIALNSVHRYVCSGTPERKIKQYYKLLLEIKKQRYEWIDKNTNCKQIKQSILNMHEQHNYKRG